MRRARALHTWDESSGAAPTDLHFEQGQEFQLVSESTPGGGWFTGSIDGTEGIFPSNFVEVIEVPESSAEFAEKEALAKARAEKRRNMSKAEKMAKRKSMSKAEKMAQMKVKLLHRDAAQQKKDGKLTNEAKYEEVLNLIDDEEWIQAEVALRLLLNDLSEEAEPPDPIEEAEPLEPAQAAGGGASVPLAVALPPIPKSPMSGRTLANSKFKEAYGKAKAPTTEFILGQKLADVIQYYCRQHDPEIPYDDDEGQEYFELLTADMHADDSLEESVQRMWTSFRQLRGRELCYMLSLVVRDDPPDDVRPAAALTRAINRLCVTAGAGATSRPAIHPPDNVCYRGGGFNDLYRDFFVAGREFRQPAFLATSFSEDIARKFIRMRGSAGGSVLWVVRIHPVHKCAHVNLVTRRVPNLPDEQEYLFAPYSAFTVLNASWKAGTADDPHVIELAAAPDNRGPSEDLPLAPWS